MKGKSCTRGQANSFLSVLLSGFTDERIATIDGEKIQWCNENPDLTVQRLILSINNGFQALKNFAFSLFSFLDIHFVVPALKGMWEMEKSKTNPFVYVDNDFENWELCAEAEGPTKKTKGTGIQLDKDATFQNMYDDILKNVASPFWDLRQIWEFVNKFSQHLKDDGTANFFFVRKKIKGEYRIFVVYVRRDSDGWYARVYRLEYDGVWRAVFRHRVFVPQQ